MDKISFDDILNFAESEDMENGGNLNRLRQSWTQYCKESTWFSNVDTHNYDTRVTQIWNTLCENPTFHFNFCTFDMFMAKNLV